MKEYSVYLGQEKCGVATVTEQGLYYRIRCICSISGSVPVRIGVSGEKEADLGLCVPMDGAFGLVTSIPINRIGRGELRFCAKARHTTEETFVTVTPDEPFRYITRLTDAYLAKRNGVTGIAFRTSDRSPVQRDSDQNP